MGTNILCSYLDCFHNIQSKEKLEFGRCECTAIGIGDTGYCDSIFIPPENIIDVLKNTSDRDRCYVKCVACGKKNKKGAMCEHYGRDD